MRVGKQYVSPRCKSIPVVGKSMLVTSPPIQVDGLHDVTYGGPAGDEPVGGNAKGRGGVFDDFDGSLWCVTLLLAVASFLMGTLPLRAHDFEAAHTFTYQGEQKTVTIYYNIISGTTNVEVTRGQLEDGTYIPYARILDIPATVTHDGTTYNVTSLGYRCFYESAIESLTLPEGLQKIDTGILYLNTAAYRTGTLISSLHIPSTVTTIAQQGLYYSSIATLTFAENSQLKTLGSNFIEFTSIKEITLPKSVESIDQAFKICNPLTSITVEDGCENYMSQNGVLYKKTDGQATTLIRVPSQMDCTGFSLPETVTAIASDALDAGTSSNSKSAQTLTTLDLSHVATIGASAFNNQKSLTTVTLGEGLTSIGNEAFSGCSSLNNIALPASLTTLGNNPFARCTSLTSLTNLSENYTIETDADKDDYMVIFNKDKTTLLAYPASRTNTTYNVPATVKTIQARAFSNNSTLTTVTLPDGLTTIGNYAFYSSAITSMAFPSSLKSIGALAIAYCASLKTISGLKDTQVTTLPEQAFRNNTAWTGDEEGNLELPSGLTSCGYYTFANCAIKHVTLPDGLTATSTRMFYDCTQLESAQTGSQTKTLTSETFLNCSKLTSVTLNEGLTTIGTEAFENCKALTALHIPSTVTSIGSNILQGNTVLESLTVAEGNTTYKAIDNVLYNKAGTTLIYVAPSNTDEEIHLAASVTTIGQRALANLTKARTLYITSKVKSIGSNAFNGSGFTTFVLSTATPPTITEMTFNGLNHDVTIYYPISSDEAFQGTTRGQTGKADWGDLDDTTVGEEEDLSDAGKNYFALHNGDKTLNRGYTMILDELYSQDEAKDLEEMRNGTLSLVKTGEGSSGIDHGYTWLYRTVAKDTWNTVCLPITLTKQQATDFFGEGFEVAEFKNPTEGQSATAYDEESNTYTLHFTTTTDFSSKADDDVVIEANKPYLVWATQARTRDDYYTYTVKGNPVAYSDNLSTGYELTEEGTFNLVGTYYPHKLEYKNGEEPSTCPYYYMYDNKIYHASGSGAQYVNGFRAYFELGFAESGDGDGNNARARMGGIALSFDETQQEVATRLEGAEAADLLGIEFPADIYSLDGRMVRSAQQGTQGLSRGIYIKNGKKVVVP